MRWNHVTGARPDFDRNGHVIPQGMRPFDRMHNRFVGGHYERITHRFGYPCNYYVFRPLTWARRRLRFHVVSLLLHPAVLGDRGDGVPQDPLLVFRVGACLHAAGVRVRGTGRAPGGPTRGGPFTHPGRNRRRHRETLPKPGPMAIRRS